MDGFSRKNGHGVPKGTPENAKGSPRDTHKTKKVALRVIDLFKNISKIIYITLLFITLITYSA